MRRIFGLIPVVSLFFPVLSSADIETDWAYHAQDELLLDYDIRGKEDVPGEAYTFVHGKVPRFTVGEEAVVYLLTDKEYAGDDEEQIYIRWWNGYEENWIQGEWIKNITLGAAGIEAVGRFKDKPEEGEKVVDLWRFQIDASIMVQGEHYYCFQMKGWDAERGFEERYLLRKSDAVEFGGVNNLGQVWTASPAEFFGNDWKAMVLPMIPEPSDSDL